MQKGAIIFVAAGRQQLLPISVAKKMGFAVIAIDQNPQAPAFKVVDEAICLSAYRSEPIIGEIIALKESYDFRAVVTRSSGIPVDRKSTRSITLSCLFLNLLFLTCH